MADDKITAVTDNQLLPLPFTDPDGSRHQKPDPKFVVMSYPPPENTRRYDEFSERKNQRWRGCKICVFLTIGVLFVLIIAAAAVFFLLSLSFRPKVANFTVTDLSIRRMDLASSLLTSPEFDVTVRADNPNERIGIDYRSGGEVQVLYGGVLLAKGPLPVFYQPAKNVTVFQTALKGPSIVVADSVRLAMENEEKDGRVPFRFRIRAPVKIRVGSVKSWRIVVKVKCDVEVDALSEKTKVVSQHCKARL